MNKNKTHHQAEVIVKITGGLGNQMFQYACAKAVALQTGAQVKLDIQQSQWHARRQWQLNQFAISLPVASVDDLNHFCADPLPKRKIRRLDWMSGKAQTGAVYRKLFRKILKSNTIHPDLYLTIENPENIDSLANIQPPAYLDGYWQNSAYFRQYETVIREEFNLQTKLSSSAANFSDKISRLDHPVSVHVRRGDYLSPKVKRMFEVMPLEYYQQAMALLSAAEQKVTFVMFSDDMDWVKQTFADSGYPMLFIDAEHTGIEDQQLMAKCHHHIIANSTFSWWGAWLGDAVDKKVVAPAQWGLSESVQHITRGIIPEEWIRV